MIKITKKDIAWNYAGTIFNVGMGIFILPIILKMLSKQDLGIWYVFGSLASLVNLVDFGFSPTITRNITYAWSGAKELLSEGTPNMSEKSEPNYNLLSGIINASKHIYMILSIVTSIILLTAGTAYIISITPENNSKYIISWIIYAVAIFINLYYSYWMPFLKGVGAIKEANQATVISRALYIVFSIIGLLMNGGLIWLSIMYLISGLLLRVFSKMFFIRKTGVNMKLSHTSNEYTPKSIFKIVWPNAKKSGVVAIGAWLITRSSTLICSTFFGLEETAQYGLSLQLLSLVGSFASILFSSYIPEMISLKVNKNIDRFKMIFARAIFLQWLLGIVGVLGVVYVAPFLLNIIGSNSNLLPTNILLLLGVILFLEWNHSTFATLITISNKVPFVNASILSGIAIVTISLLLANFTGLGILGLIISQGSVQLMYSNWYWPLYIFKENQLSVPKILKLVFIDAKELFSKYTKSKGGTP